MTISATPADLLLRLRQHLLVALDARAVLRLARARRGGDPFLLGRQRALAGAFLLLLLLQALALLLQPGRVVALERIAAAALDLQDPAGDVVQEVAVVGDDHHGAGVVVQRVLQPGDAFGVQMVGRLVEQQQVGLFQQQPAQRDAPPLAARQRGDRARRPAGSAARPARCPRAGRAPSRPRRRSSPAGRPARPAASFISSSLIGSANFIGDFVEPVERGLQVGERLLDVLAHGLVGIELRFLLQVADAHALGAPRPRRRIRCRCRP